MVGVPFHMLPIRVMKA